MKRYVQVHPASVIKHNNRRVVRGRFFRLIILWIFILVTCLFLIMMTSQFTMLYNRRLGRTTKFHHPLWMPSMVGLVHRNLKVEELSRGTDNLQKGSLEPFLASAFLKKVSITVEVNFALRLNQRLALRTKFLIDRAESFLADNFPSYFDSSVNDTGSSSSTVPQQNLLKKNRGKLLSSSRSGIQYENERPDLDKLKVLSSKISSLSDIEAQSEFKCFINETHTVPCSRANFILTTRQSNLQNIVFDPKLHQDSLPLFLQEYLNEKLKYERENFSSIENLTLVKRSKNKDFLTHSSEFPSKNSRIFKEENRNLSICSKYPPGVSGQLDLKIGELEDLDPENVLKSNSWVLPGGFWRPSLSPKGSCLARHSVAIIIPYRDRLDHLVIFLSWIHSFLRRQQLLYTVFVVEQFGNETFNKGSIMNAGFMEAWQRTSASCFIFHDVDLLPENDKNMYSCPQQPRHLSAEVDTFNYTLPYSFLVGGVLSIRGDHFLKVNGYSNLYWGWGGEDDDMSHRIKKSGLIITRPPFNVGRYIMIKHAKRTPIRWKTRTKLVATSSRRFRKDGLNTLNYTLVSSHAHPLFTHLLVDIGSPPQSFSRQYNSSS